MWSEVQVPIFRSFADTLSFAIWMVEHWVAAGGQFHREPWLALHLCTDDFGRSDTALEASENRIGYGALSADGHNPLELMAFKLIMDEHEVAADAVYVCLDRLQELEQIAHQRYVHGGLESDQGVCVAIWAELHGVLPRVAEAGNRPATLTKQIVE